MPLRIKYFALIILHRSGDFSPPPPTPAPTTQIAEAEQFLAKLIMTLGIKSDIREGRAIIIR
jgi:hypothetical protein